MPSTQKNKKKLKNQVLQGFEPCRAVSLTAGALGPSIYPLNTNKPSSSSSCRASPKKTKISKIRSRVLQGFEPCRAPKKPKKFKNQVLQGFEPWSLDSKSRVLTTTP